MRCFITLLALLAPSAALALSCVAPNAGFEINNAVDAGRPLPIVVVGTLIPPAPAPRRRAYETVTARYRLVGTQLGAGGDRPFTGRVTVRSTCVLDQWCGPVPGRGDLAVFLLKPSGDGGTLLHLGPCPSGIYTRYGPSQFDALRRCLSNRRCSEADLATLDYTSMR